MTPERYPERCGAEKQRRRSRLSKWGVRSDAIPGFSGRSQERHFDDSANTSRWSGKIHSYQFRRAGSSKGPCCRIYTTIRRGQATSLAGLRISRDIRNRLPVCTDPHGSPSGLGRITRGLGLRFDRHSDVRGELEAYRDNDLARRRIFRPASHTHPFSLLSSFPFDISFSLSPSFSRPHPLLRM